MNFYETLITCNRSVSNNNIFDEVPPVYSFYFITEAENRQKAVKKIKKFASNYYTDEPTGKEIAEFVYKYVDGEIITINKVRKTTTEKFLKTRTSDMFFIR